MLLMQLREEERISVCCHDTNSPGLRKESIFKRVLNFADQRISQCDENVTNSKVFFSQEYSDCCIYTASVADM